MQIRKTALEDLESVMKIYGKARVFMKDSGNPNQWVNGYPERGLIQSDILKKSSYVCTDEGRIVGVFAFTRGADPTYLKIYDGSWLNEEPYGVVHRIASDTGRKGVATHCLNWCFKQCGNIRIDTHRDNLAMRNLLEKNQFIRCGIIYLEDGAERIAYQRCMR